jgi:chitin disaccharide deacetylase
MADTARTISLCVDDYGLHEGINQAAIDLAQMGRVHAISCMTAGPAWLPQAGRLIPFASQGVDVGLHLDFTENLPGQTQRWPLAEFIRNSYLGKLDRRNIEQEINTQLDAFEKGLGREPAYIDGHQHVHQLPIVRDELLKILQLRYPAQRPWLRSTRSKGLAWAQWGSGWRSVIKPLGIEWLGNASLIRQAKAMGYAHNRGLLGVYDFSGGSLRYASLLERWLTSADPGDLLMCHPSRVCDRPDALIKARLAEYEVLSSPLVDQLLSRHGVTLQALSSSLGLTRQ